MEESLHQKIYILIGVFFLSHIAAAQLHILDIQYAIYNHTDTYLSLEFHKSKALERNCDTFCMALKDFHIEADIVKLSSQTLGTKALVTYQWQLLSLIEIIFGIMQQRYLQQPLPPM